LPQELLGLFDEPTGIAPILGVVTAGRHLDAVFSSWVATFVSMRRTYLAAPGPVEHSEANDTLFDDDIGADREIDFR